MAKRKILFFLSGSIAAFKAAGVISKLVQQGHEVQTVATPAALKFIGRATLEGLTGKPVLSDLWEPGRAMDHIHLSRWADEGILCPASANTLAKIARGLADELVATMILAWPKNKPLHIFPAMNVEMLSHPATQENLRLIKSYGYRVHETGAGNLACGEEGSGRLMEIEEILTVLSSPFSGAVSGGRSAASSGVKRKVLITAGATRESIDGVRFISNVSTGTTGARLADLFVESGWDVSYLCGEGAKTPSAAVKIARFSDFQSLDQALRANLSQRDFDMVIHAAAVSDYSIDKVNGHKPSKNLKLSSQGRLAIEFKENYKILPRLKEYSQNKNIVVIGFKLTVNETAEARFKIAAALLGPQVDAIVANDWAELTKDRAQHPGEFIRAGGSRSFKNLTDLYQQIEGASHGPVS
jgi:phosphopantothenoylcysteine decarboxylase/phosphopantothenate--cysteine ligase